MATPTTRPEWIEAFTLKLSVEAPTDAEIGQILDLAAMAAHSSERTAAPVACWIAAKSGLPLDEVLEVAKFIAEEE